MKEFYISRRRFIELGMGAAFTQLVGCKFPEQNKNSERIQSQPAWSPPVADIYYPTINAAANQFHIPSTLIHALIIQESGFNPTAVSTKDAEGLTQIIPSTKIEITRELNMPDFNSFDPVHSIYGGAHYLAKLINFFDGNYSLGVRAYHDGAGNVLKGNLTDKGKTHNDFIMGMYRESHMNQSPTYNKWLKGMVSINGGHLKNAFENQGLDYYAYIDSIMIRVADSDTLQQPSQTHLDQVGTCRTILGHGNLPGDIRPGNKFIINGHEVIVQDGDTAWSIWEQSGKPESLQFCS